MVERQKWVEQMLAQLLAALPAGKPRRLTLDQIGEAVGAQAIGTDDIEALFDRLEAEGIEVGSSGEVDISQMLREVIQTALLLKKEGVRPSPSAIAERSSLSENAVRVALLYSEVLRG